MNDVGNWEGAGVKKWPKLPTDSTEKLPTLGRGVLKNPEKLPTSFMHTLRSCTFSPKKIGLILKILCRLLYNGLKIILMLYRNFWTEFHKWFSEYCLKLSIFPCKIFYSFWFDFEHFDWESKLTISNANSFQFLKTVKNINRKIGHILTCPNKSFERTKKKWRGS